MKAMRWIFIALIGFALGTGIAFALTPSGSGVPASAANRLVDDLDAIEGFADAGECNRVNGRFDGVESRLAKLTSTPDDVADDLRTAFRRVRTAAREQCKAVADNKAAEEDRRREEEAAKETTPTTPTDDGTDEDEAPVESTPDPGGDEGGGPDPGTGEAPGTGGGTTTPGADQAPQPDPGGGAVVPDDLEGVQQRLEKEREKWERRIRKAQEQWNR